MTLDELNANRCAPDSHWMRDEKLRPYARIVPDDFPIQFRNDKYKCTAVFRRVDGVIVDAWAFFDDGEVESTWHAWTQRVSQIIRTTQPGDEGIRLFKWKNWKRVK